MGAISELYLRKTGYSELDKFHAGIVSRATERSTWNHFRNCQACPTSTLAPICISSVNSPQQNMAKPIWLSLG
jgi:hypothetical protein